jgi:transposase IS4-like protein/DDE family transposase
VVFLSGGGGFCCYRSFMVEGSDSDRERVRLTDRISVGVLTRLFPRDLVDEVIAQTGRREQRSRLLPAHVVVYFVLGLALYFGEAYEEVMRRLVGGLRFLRTWSSDWRVPTTSALVQARVRLGEAPLKELFHRVAVPMARRSTRGAWFRAWRVTAVDGVLIDVPDTPENNQEFDHSSAGASRSAFPQARIVGVAECGTHAIVGAEVGSWGTGEHTLAVRLMPQCEPDMLVLFDQAFYSYQLWHTALRYAGAVVFRVSSTLVLPALDTYPDGSYRSVLLDPARQSAIRRRARKAGDGGRAIYAAEGTPCRVVEYMVDNRGEQTETFCLVTSILDWEEAPAYEVAALYHERWEFEITLDEIETHQLGRGRVLRSKSPEMVRQEIWGILLAHYAIRHLMHEAADTVDIDPDRLSFMRSLRLVRRQITGQADFPPS